MVNVDVVRPGSLTQIVGPVATLRRILSARDYFLENGLDITIYNGARTFQKISDVQTHGTGNSKSRRHRLFEWMANHAVNSYILSVILVEYKHQTVKRFVHQYLKKERNKDVVVLHSTVESYWYLKLRKNRDAKCAVFFHNDCIPNELIFMMYPKLRGSWYERLLLKRYSYVVNNADKLCYICEIGMKNMNRFYPVSVGKSALVINGITDFTLEEKEANTKIKDGRKDDTINLCCVGSVTTRKAQYKVIEGISMLSRKRAEKIHLTIVGGGADLNHCKEMVEKANLNDIVSFTGAVPNTEVYKYLAASDVFVLLSENEGLPISIIEAMRAGLAVISTNVSGIPELVSNNNGVLINSDAKEFAHVLLSNEYDWKQMGKNSRQLFEEKYTFERMREDYVAMVKSMIE